MMTAIGRPKIRPYYRVPIHETEGAAVIDGELTEWFAVKTGLRQGCLLSPTLFNIFLEFVMK